MTWTKHGYGALGALELASIILAWIVIVIGFIAFLTEIAGCLIIFIILVLLSALFTLAVVIFCFIGTQTRYWDEYVGCNAKYDGLLSVWNSVDNYLYAVDSLLCSDRCKCYFGDITTNLYTANSTTAPYFNTWVKENRTLSALKFQDCPQIVQDDAMNIYYMSNAYYNHTFRDDWFHTYYKHIEDFFKCTGFCGTSYNGPGGSTKIVKYLFSGIDRGIPEHFGCLGAIMDWLRKTLNAFASCGIFLFVIEFILFVVGILMLCGSDGDTTTQPTEKTKNDDKEKKQQEEERRRELLRREEEAKRLKEDEERKRREEEEKKKKAQEIEMINTSYVPPQSQQDEIDIRFNPSVSKA